MDDTSKLSSDLQNAYGIGALFEYLLKNAKWIVVIPFTFTVLVAIWTLTISNTYLADSTLSPSEEAQGGGINGMLGNQFGGLASLAGINLGAESTDNVTIALTIASSRKFIADFVNKYDIKPEIMAAENWDEESGALVFDQDIYDPDAKKWTREPQNNRPAEPTDLEVYERFIEILTTDRNKSTGLINISIEYYSPAIAKQWLDWLIQEVNQVMRSRQIEMAQENIDYLQKQIEDIDDIDMRNVFYQLIQEQTKNLMLAEVRSDFVFSVIDPPVIPESRYAPSRTLICLFAGFLSGFLVVCFYIIRFLIFPPRT